MQKANVNPDDTLWSAYRVNSLSDKEKKTYRTIDSIGYKYKADRFLKTTVSLVDGKIPFKFVDIDLGRIIKYNNYEGFRLELSLHNNAKISDKIIVGGYFAYGFKDKEYKYGGDLSVVVSKPREISIGVSYSDDVTESGGLSFYKQNSLFNDSYLQSLYVKRMDRTISEEAFLKFKTFRYMKAKLFLNYSQKSITNDYRFEVEKENLPELVDHFNFTELGLNLYYCYKEKFIKTPYLTMSMGSKFPTVFFNYSRGFNNILNGDYQYDRFDIKIKKSFLIKNLGTTSFQLQSGYINGNLPYCNLYTGIAAFRKDYNIFVQNSFTTMRMNEFLSNRYAALFLSHSFGNLLLKIKKFTPEFVVATNLCIGDLNNPLKHFNVDFSTLDKGYIESGLLIKNIFRSSNGIQIGIGAFHRYGYYSLSKTIDNFSFIITADYGSAK